MALVPVHVRYVKPGDCEIQVHGTSITGVVREMTFHAGAKDIVGTLTLSLRAPVLEVDGTQRVRIDNETCVALVALGWTPPPGEPAEETLAAGPYPRREIHWTSATGYETESIPRHDDFEAGETDPVVGGGDGA